MEGETVAIVESIRDECSADTWGKLRELFPSLSKSPTPSEAALCI